MSSQILVINGLKTAVDISKKDIDEVYLPLLRELSDLQKKLGRRIIVFLAAPPGCGKSTLVSFLQQYAQKDETIGSVQGAGIDGFHYPNSYLTSHTMEYRGREYPMSVFKGGPSTFDVEKLAVKLQELTEKKEVSWPVYSRITHDPVEDGDVITGDIVVIEGNYLLDPDDRWNSLLKYADYTIFMYNSRQVLKKRLIRRKMDGGSSEEEAVSHYYQSDRLNVNRVLGDHAIADLTLRLGTRNNILSVERK